MIVICLSRLIWSLYKLYKLYKLTFYRLCSCKDRATVRHRPHSREKKNVTPRHFAWQAWHKLTPTVVSVAGVAQTHTYYRFTWQAWHKLTSTVVLRGSRGTNSHLLSFCVAGVGRMALGGRRSINFPRKESYCRMLGCLVHRVCSQTIWTKLPRI